jgi:thymidylate synthase (FAD)
MTDINEVLNDKNYKKVLDFGFVGVVDHMGTDESIVRAARVSYSQGTKTMRDNRALIRYLVRHAHTSPFEMNEIIFHLKLPIFVMRQLVRHRTACLTGDNLLYFANCHKIL